MSVVPRLERRFPLRSCNPRNFYIHVMPQMTSRVVYHDSSAVFDRIGLFSLELAGDAVLDVLHRTPSVLDPSDVLHAGSYSIRAGCVPDACAIVQALQMLKT